MSNVLELFDPITARWFKRSVGTPTAVQENAWPAIAAGGHTLVSAPTGTGKTLSAFLVFIDRLLAQKRAGTLPKKLQLIYISPLKSLAGDIRENLRRPLDGIVKEACDETGAAWSPQSGLEVAIRTGDTPQNERRRMFRSPPHILITTPESLYLMLTAKQSRPMLSTARWIIIDELHALIDSKRGAHLMLSLARLDRLCDAPLQRIGLSATIEPLSRAADYLSPEPVTADNPAPVTIVAPKMRKNVKLEIASADINPNRVQEGVGWPDIARTVYTFCEGTRTAIAFIEARAYAEKLAYFVNQIAGEGFARTHHGSLSKEQRLEVERDLRSGDLRLLCATSSMELGIDVGDIDQVFQIGCPYSISSTMQRLGRAGHNPGRTSVMYIFPRAPGEGLFCGLTAEVVRRGGIEYSKPPKMCLDILAQHLVSMATGDGYAIDEVMEILPHAYPFREVTREDVKSVLAMLAGDYEHQRDLPVRPRVLYDRLHERVEGDSYSRMLAISAGGTIPDRGLYAVKTENGVKLGELDEEFVFESQQGRKFLLGTFAWQIVKIEKDAVTVRPTKSAGATPPFWNGDQKGRRIQTGVAFGEIFRRLNEAHETDTLQEELESLGLDTPMAMSVQNFIRRQIAVTGGLPDERTMIAEHFQDETGNSQIMVHSVFGRPVNEPLAILACEAAKRLTNKNIRYIVEDDGFILFPYGECELPKGLLSAIIPETAEAVLKALLPTTTIFNMTFRYNAGHALMMGVRKAGRQPLWVQRMRGAEMLDALVRQENHPLIRETTRECLEDYWDLPSTLDILKLIHTGMLQVLELDLLEPSPMSLPLRRKTEKSMMYDYAPSTEGITIASYEALQKAQSQPDPEDMIAPDPVQLALTQVNDRRPDSEARLHSLLMMEGDMLADDMSDLDAPVEWLESLERQARVTYIEPGVWIAAEQAEDYEAALVTGDAAARSRIVRRLLRYRGAQTPELVAERYLWKVPEALEVLEALRSTGSAVLYEGLYYHAELFGRAQRETVKMRRREFQTLPAERYAALLAGRALPSGSAEERLEAALYTLCGLRYPAAAWEEVLLPGRAGDFRPSALDSVLAQGKFFWRLHEDGALSFERYADIDWETEPSSLTETLSGNEGIIVEALKKSGAVFAQRFTGAVTGESPSDALQRLMTRGFVTADSFIPVRQWLQKAKTDGASARQKVRARVLTVSAGRWDLCRPLRTPTVEEQLELMFDRALMICRETVQEFGPDLNLTWSAALHTLRVWEYIGRARRGYFIEGFSGMQFIRGDDFAGITHAFEHPDGRLVWLPAIDPLQPWGKTLQHQPDRAFLNVPGTTVALRAGLPVAVFERQGKVLRVFDPTGLDAVLKDFVLSYNRRRLFAHAARLTLTQYPPEAHDALKVAGFVREMNDYVLYRGENR
jgi:ATP-dependent Lhr-like helicase